MEPNESNIHDVTIEKGITPYPRGVWENYQRTNKQFQEFQRRWYQTDEDRRGVTSIHRPKILDFPVKMSDLPTHFMKREGNRLGKPIEWPKAGVDTQVICNGEEHCSIFEARSYLCKRHNPSTSDLEVISSVKTDKKPSVDNLVVIKQFLSYNTK